MHSFRHAAVVLAALVAPLAPAQELTRDAAKLYVQFCASCHGENLDRGVGGSLLEGTWMRPGGDDSHLEQIITQGMPDSGMPGFGEVLDAPRVRALAVYVRERAVRAEERNTSFHKPAENQVVRGEAAAYRLETWVEGLSIPWALAFLPGTNDALVAERDGRLLLVREGKLQPRPIEGTPAVVARGQGGLMVVQAHPDYAAPGNGWIYLAFSDPGENNTVMTAIVRGRVRDGRWTDEQPIYRAAPEHYSRAHHHFGTRLVFDQGYLFFAVGDRGAQDLAQELGRPNGKIHRIHDDGRVPADNPFVGRAGALPTIWSYGHRNPQGIVARPGTTGDSLQIWLTEHGPRGGDELNLVKRGANFGWPVVTHGLNYNGTPISARTSHPDMESPVVHWTPSIAVCGLDFYSGERFPAWRGNLFVGALRSEEVRRVVLEGDRVKSQEVLFRGIGRVRTVHEGPDGLLYVGLENPGRIVRLVPAD
jgi:glucose/arabinose dehydrogenase